MSIILSSAKSASTARPWLSEPVVKDRGKDKKNKNQAVIVNAFFEECSKKCDDPFWADIFHGIALGKPPKKFVIKDTTLLYKRGSRVFSVIIPDNIYEAISVCVEFIRRHASLYSEKDQARSKQEEFLRQSMVEDVDLSWADLSKDMKKAFILSFVKSIRLSHKLSDKETSQLSNIINIGIFLRYFHKDNIIIKDNCIQSITPLMYDEKTRTFAINPLATPSKVSRGRTSSTSKGEHIDLWDSWGRVVSYLKKLEEKMTYKEAIVFNSPMEEDKESTAPTETSACSVKPRLIPCRRE